MTANDPDALKLLTTTHGVQLRSFPDEILRAMRKAAGEIIPAAVESDPMSKKVWQSYSAFQARVLNRGLLTDGAVWRMRSI